MDHCNPETIPTILFECFWLEEFQGKFRGGMLSILEYEQNRKLVYMLSSTAVVMCKISGD